jgi:hypothetical protein
MTAYVNQLSGTLEPPAMSPGGDLLIEDADGKQRHDDAKHGHAPMVLRSLA